MLVLDGKLVSASVKESLKAETAVLLEKGHRAPHLAAILVGSNGASETYVASKVKNCEDIGFVSSLVRLDENVDEATLLSTIAQLNADARSGWNFGSIAATQADQRTQSN